MTTVCALAIAATLHAGTNDTGCSPVYLDDLPDPEPVVAGFFGTDVAMVGTRAIVGAFQQSGAVVLSGQVHFYHADGTSWVFDQTLFDPMGQTSASFGLDVAMSTTFAAAGAHQHNGLHTASGAATIFRFDGTQWLFDQRLVAPDQREFQEFGRSVSITDTLVAIGAPGDNAEGINAGAVYLFAYNGTDWVFQAKLAPAVVEPGDEFGLCVLLSGSSLFVGAARDTNASGTNNGAVYHFRQSAGVWTMAPTILPPIMENGSRFGTALAISGRLLLVGAPESGAIEGRAFAYVITGDAATLEDTIDPPEATDNRFGTSIAVSEERAVIGAPFSPPGGAAYAFRRVGTEWLLTGRLEDPLATPNALLGRNVTMIGRTALVGAPGLNTAAGNSSGGAFLFHIDPPLPGDANGDGAVNFADITEVLTFFGQGCGGITRFCAGDANGSRTITFADITAVLTNFGFTCP